jgi:hypothetical protein
LILVLITATVYFFVLVPATALMARIRRAAAPRTKQCPECLRKEQPGCLQDVEFEEHVG